MQLVRKIVKFSINLYKCVQFKIPFINDSSLPKSKFP